jgi:SAM-dependent methyltransferase
MNINPRIDPLLAEQVAYYRAVAPDYESLSVPGGGGSEVAAALEAFAPAGDVLELACGPGMWTELLLRHATSVTAVDAAPEMLARARALVGDDAGAGGGSTELEQRLDALGWRLTVTQTSGAFYWGAGSRGRRG